MGGGSEVVDAPFLPETQGLVDQNNPPKTKTLPLKKAGLGHGMETKALLRPIVAMATAWHCVHALHAQL